MPKGYFIPFTEKEEIKIKAEFLQKPVKRLADELNTTYGRIMRFLKRNNLEIPKQLIEKRKRDSQKKKGDIPFNKGKKQHEFMSIEAIKRTKKTRFKKGNKPHNTKHNGHERISKDGYIEVRIKCGVYKLKHRVIWEEHNGKIPKNHLIVFKDNNPLNIKIENLEMITKIENMYRNSKHNYPKEIIPSMVLTKKIENKLNTLQNG